jgi:hypothetical protein
MSLNHIIQGGKSDIPINVPGATINGNVIPPSTTTAGFVLTNNDGAGDCRWEAIPASSDIIQQGVYTPNYVVAGGSLSSGSIRYQQINNFATISGQVLLTSGLGSNAIDIQFDMPPTLRIANTEISNVSCFDTLSQGNALNGTIIYDSPTTSLLRLVNNVGLIPDSFNYVCQFIMTYQVA